VAQAHHLDSLGVAELWLRVLGLAVLKSERLACAVDNEPRRPAASPDAVLLSSEKERAPLGLAPMPPTFCSKKRSLSACAAGVSTSGGGDESGSSSGFGASCLRR
jgi:hypothetical protein